VKVLEEIASAGGESFAGGYDSRWPGSCLCDQLLGS
jgi:hypothetical protein